MAHRKHDIRIGRVRRGRDVRIGIVADTHEAGDPLALIKQLEDERCDFNVHLGDIGGSQLTTGLVHEYKQTLGNLDHLNREERERYERLRSKGLSPIWAYIEMRLGENPEARKQRMAETEASYALVVGAMSRLHPAYFVSGNVDRAVSNSDNVRASFEGNGIALIVEPMVIDLGDQAAILWPSMKPTTPQAAQRLDELVLEYAADLASKRRVVVLAHEQLFKGPPPEKYRKNVERAGYKPLTVPYFEPNPTWRHLVRLFRALPASVDLSFVHGHVHDPSSVIQAGAPYLKGTQRFGLGYRLYGLGTAERCEDGLHPGRRVLNIFCVPANEAMVLVLGKESVRIEAAGGDRAWMRG